MCGIAGLWCNTKIETNDLYTYGELMINSLLHRGPDQKGIWKDESSNFVIAHSRLSIIDLTENGSQPIQSIDGELVMAFNGEIYNYYELKESLYKDFKFKNWKGTSDTEVLLVAIEKWGIKKTLQKCQGMFAIAIWNKRLKKLTLARDRFGEKPLYWGKVKINNLPNDNIVFSSEVSSLLSLPGLKKEINYDALGNYFKFGFLPSPSSIISGINQLKPGNYIELYSKDLSSPINTNKEIKWWDIYKITNNLFKKQCRELNPQDELESILKRVVKDQSNADVPVGTFLSGGIDSSLITALLQEQSIKKIKTFTVCFPESGLGETAFNEGDYARSISNFLGTDHTEIDLNFSEAINIIPEIPNYFSEPFADSSMIPTLLISKKIRGAGIKVALSGDAGDELFGGYNRHIYGPLINILFCRQPKTFKKILTKLINILPIDNSGLKLDKKKKLINIINSDLDFNNFYESFLSEDTNQYINLINNFASTNKYPLITKEFKNLLIPSMAEKIMLADTISYLVDNILVKLDRSSMAFGLETRVPFLDHLLFEKAWNIDISNKVGFLDKKLVGKKILRNILYKYIPSKYFRTGKYGFCLPLNKWLKGPLKNWVEEIIFSEEIKKEGYLSHRQVEIIWSQHCQGIRDNTKILWTIISWQLWKKKWDRV